ncbi:permease-like cell division protein FtsX [Methylococcus sp. ANG]|uniref:permease-like cell division protein FtsX n=1 Tax=unclassified Methylococcus TaxID=2618889 RepID=UPI002104CB36|nr:permease-like cell division protein FtsX [Methylococcus sp. Mc7]
MRRQRRRAQRRVAPPAPRRRSGPTLVDRLQSYLVSHVQTAKEALWRMRRTPFAMALTLLVIAATLALPTSFHVLVKNLRLVGGDLEATNEISLYLKPDLSNDAGRKLADRLKSHAQIAETRLVTKEAGIEQLKTYSGFGEALSALNFNPLPVVIGIRPKDSLAQPGQVERLVAELKALPEVDMVQSDIQWMHRLHAMLQVAERSFGVLGALLAAAVVFIIGNTIRLELYGRREEIIVQKLLGATDRFIRRPFLYTGFWYGFLGSIGAWIVVGVMLLIVRAPIRQLNVLYGSDFSLAFLGFQETMALIGIACFLGIAGAFAVLIQHLRDMRPE